VNRHAEKTDRKYSSREESIGEIRLAVERGLSFDQACSLILTGHVESKEAIMTDALVLLIEEMHCSGGMPLKQFAMRLRISMSRLLRAKEVMQREREGVLGVKSREALAGRSDVS
jgi:hypothetical protein